MQLQNCRLTRATLSAASLCVGLLAAWLRADDQPVRDNSQHSVVKLVTMADGMQLTRNGKPYFVRGAGGSQHLELLAKIGGNSIRTWGTDNLDRVLDEAQRLGLSVSVGIWLGHERHGFDYNDADQVAEQAASVRRAILRYKDHPAVLLWGLGNEMEGYEKGDNAAIWSAINNLAVMAKQLDPHHPTMTVVAEIGGDRVKNIHRLCPDIDIVGINSYGGVTSLPQRYREAGGTKPFLITEFGPAGTWESAKTEWGTPRELTSTQKGDAYRRAFETAVTAQPQCLGGYAFTWGQKQESTATWFGMLLDRETFASPPKQKTVKAVADPARTLRLGAVDALGELWSGKPPSNQCPQIDSFELVGDEQADPGATRVVKLTASDLEGEPLKVEWFLQGEPSAYGTGGDAEEVPPFFPDAFVKTDSKQAELRLPRDGGGYRVFALVTDDHGGAAIANVPLLVKGVVPVPKAREAKLPLVVYDEGDQPQPPFAPSGWMGNTKGMKLDVSCSNSPHAGKTCLRVDYKPADGWAGIVWQSPANDWGDKPGGWNLTGAKRLTFGARGEAGGEVVSFAFGLLGKDKKFADTANGKLENVTLERDWKQYSIELSGQDLTRIKTGFSWTVAGNGQPVTFYLDDVQFTDESRSSKKIMD